MLYIFYKCDFLFTKLIQLCSTHKVVEFEVFLSNDATETGIVVMSGSGQFHMINNIEDVKVVNVH